MAASEYPAPGASNTGQDCDFLCAPVAAGALSIIVNLGPSAVDKLDPNSPIILTMELLAQIYAGNITRWNDQKLVDAQQDPKIAEYLGAMNQLVYPLHRSDSSGTTMFFSWSLSQSSKWWADTYGYSISSNLWPTERGSPRLLTSNDQMVRAVAYTIGAIGYVGQANLRDPSNLDYMSSYKLVAILNKRGQAVQPSRKSISATVKTYAALKPYVLSSLSKQPRTLSTALTTGVQSIFAYPSDSTIYGLFSARTNSSLPDYSVLRLHDLDGDGVYPMTSFTWLCIWRDYNVSSEAMAMTSIYRNIVSRVPAVDAVVPDDKKTPNYGDFVALPEDLQHMVLFYISGNIVCDAESCYAEGRTRLIVTLVILGLISGLSLLTAVAAFLGIFAYRCFIYRQHKKKHSNQQSMTQALIDSYNSEVEISGQSGVPLARFREEDIVLEQQIGQGSFATVFKGKWLGAIVAIKRFMISSKNESLMTEFVKEAQLMSSLKHPNIVQFYGAAVHHPYLYIITEYCEKGDLLSLLKNRSIKLNMQKTLKLALDVCRGMIYLHAAEPPIIHRDLKSANLLVDGDFNVKITDFGLSRVVDARKSMTVCGTAETCAPEVLSNDRYTEKADVYSFGIVLWQMLTREPLYPSEKNFFQLTSKVVNEGLRPPLDQHNFPSELKQLMQECWDQDPSHRPDFKECLSRLEAYLRKVEADAERRKQSQTQSPVGGQPSSIPA